MPKPISEEAPRSQKAFLHYVSCMFNVRNNINMKHIHTNIAAHVLRVILYVIPSIVELQFKTVKNLWKILRANDLHCSFSWNSHGILNWT